MKCLELINLRTGPEILEVLSEKKKKKVALVVCNKFLLKYRRMTKLHRTTKRSYYFFLCHKKYVLFIE